MRRWISLLTAIVMLAACFSAFAEESTFDVQAFLTRLMTGDDLPALYAQFTPEMQSAMTLTDVANLWPSLTATAGPFERFAGETASEEVGGYTTLTQTMNMQAIGLSCMVALDAQGRIAGLRFSPCAKEADAPLALPENCVEEAVIVEESPWQLPGTLTLPANTTSPVPAVVLVHGSGPSDRDETIGAVKPFRDLAESLAASGIASLRYDKRTYVYGAQIAASQQLTAAMTAEEETIQDAIAAGRLLASDSRVDASRIFLVGHSLGAMLAPRIVSESDGLFAGMVLLCGSNASLLDIMIRQSEDAVAALPADQRALQTAALDEIRLQAAALPEMTADEAQTVTIAGQPGFYFWEMTHHPSAAELITSLALPTLIINGDRDFQVNRQEGREGWESSLPMDASYLAFLWADVNHLLMRPDVDEALAGTAAEYMVPCTLDEEVASAVSSFILTKEE